MVYCTPVFMINIVCVIIYNENLMEEIKVMSCDLHFSNSENKRPNCPFYISKRCSQSYETF